MTATKHHRPHRTASAWWRRLAVAAVVLLAGTACFAGGSDDDGDATAVFTMDDASADEPASEMESMSDEGGFDMADDEMATEEETSLSAAAATEETGTVRLSGTDSATASGGTPAVPADLGRDIIYTAGYLGGSNRCLRSC